MSRILAVLALSGLFSSAAGAEPAGPLKAICDTLCGDWVPAEPSPDLPQRELHLAWDEASGEIHGTLVSTGWEGAADSERKIAFRHDVAKGTAYVAEVEGFASLVSTVSVEPDGIHIIGLVPGKPELVAVTIYTAPGPGRLHEVQGESGQQYNAVIFEADYVRRAK